VPEIRELDAQTAVVRRAQTDADAIRATVDENFPALFAQLAERGVRPAGPPFIRFLEAGARMELEFGVPVPPGLQGAETVTLPGGRAAVLEYTGPYDGLRAANERLFAWLEEQGEEAAGPFWEVYLSDPRAEPDPSKWRTDIVVPLA
jgi:GyrI-like small molecule binding domain